MDILNNIKQLKEDGYTIIHNVYYNDEIIEYWKEFNLWHTNVPELEELHNLIDFNGIFKHHQAGLAVLILNVVMMTVAYFIAKKFVSGIAQQKCIALECGLQNGTLAVFVATLIFDEVTYMIPTAAYALIMYITGFIFIYILRKSN